MCLAQHVLSQSSYSYPACLFYFVISLRGMGGDRWKASKSNLKRFRFSFCPGHGFALRCGRPAKYALDCKQECLPVDHWIRIALVDPAGPFFYGTSEFPHESSTLG